MITHLGLGDNIIQTGLACVLAEHYGTIAFPCYQQYERSVKSFFVDTPAVKIYTLPHRADWTWGSPPDSVYDQQIKNHGMNPRDAIRAGLYAGRGLDTDFTQAFYDHTGVPYEVRWSKCPIASAATKVEQLPPEFPNKRRIFMHDDPARGYIIRKLINRNEAFKPDFNDPNQSILRYIDLINAAYEIHVIDSSFFHLVNSLPSVNARLYLHQYPRWPRALTFRYPTRLSWTYIPFA